MLLELGGERLVDDVDEPLRCDRPVNNAGDDEAQGVAVKADENSSGRISHREDVTRGQEVADRAAQLDFGDPLRLRRRLRLRRSARHPSRPEQERGEDEDGEDAEVGSWGPDM